MEVIISHMYTTTTTNNNNSNNDNNNSKHTSNNENNDDNDDNDIDNNHTTRRRCPSGRARTCWALRAKYYTPAITQMNIHWKMSLKVHWTIPVQIHWARDNFWCGKGEKDFKQRFKVPEIAEREANGTNILPLGFSDYQRLFMFLEQSGKKEDQKARSVPLP